MTSPPHPARSADLSPTGRGERLGGVLAIALAAVVYLGALGNDPFYSWRETREALVVQAAVRTGEWILPLRNGTEIPTKPPLYYWLAGAVAALRDAVDPLAMRLPSALLGIAAIVAIFLRGGLAAALVLATSLEWLRSGTTARVDMTQAAFLTAAFLAFEAATRAAKPSVGSLVALYGCMALATLAKGPTGILLPVLVGVADLAVRRDRDVRRLRPLAGLAVAIAIPAVWYLLAAERGGEEFVRQQILAENLGRFFAAKSFDLPHVHSWWYYVPAFLGGFAPWTLFLPPLAAYLWRQRRRLETERLLYPLVWFAVVFVFFSLASGKRPVYLLSLYPAAALLVGGWWSGVVEKRWAIPPAFAWALRAVAAAAASVAIAFALALVGERIGIDVLERIRPWLKPRDRAEIDLLASIVANGFPMLFLAAVALLLAAGLFVWATARAAWRETLVALALVAACGAALANAVYFPAVAWRRSYAPFLASVRHTIAPEDSLSFYRSFDHGAVFYAERRVGRLRGDPCGALVPGRDAYALVTARDWEALDETTRARFDVVSESEATGPRGRDPLLLLRVRADGCR